MATRFIMRIPVKRRKLLKHEFVEFIPQELREGTIYVSVAYATAVHKCCCGCGKEVVTPISPTDWELLFDGKSISLNPSIGNWGFPCQSHYWIERDNVIWAPKWSRERIMSARVDDASAKEKYFGNGKRPHASEAITGRGGPGEARSRWSCWCWPKR